MLWIDVVNCYLTVVVSLLTVDSSLLDSASATDGTRLPRTNDPPWKQKKIKNKIDFYYMRIFFLENSRRISQVEYFKVSHR